MKSQVPKQVFETGGNGKRCPRLPVESVRIGKASLSLDRLFCDVVEYLPVPTCAYFVSLVNGSCHCKRSTPLCELRIAISVVAFVSPLAHTFSTSEVSFSQPVQELIIHRPNQMKFMIKKWGIEKKVKSSEMRHIIEIQKWRQEQNPLKQTRFVVRGRPVTEAKIERYKKTHTIESNLLTGNIDYTT